jgi:hypothetical protein
MSTAIGSDSDEMIVHWNVSQQRPDLDFAADDVPERDLDANDILAFLPTWLLGGRSMHMGLLIHTNARIVKKSVHTCSKSSYYQRSTTRNSTCSLTSMTMTRNIVIPCNTFLLLTTHGHQRGRGSFSCRFAVRWCFMHLAAVAAYLLGGHRLYGSGVLHRY